MSLADGELSGNQYTARQLEDLFWPVAAVREGRAIPTNLQLPIRAALPCHRVLNPDTEDMNGEPLYIVGKYGNTTKLTLGRYSGMDAYTCTDLGEESREVVVYNYSKTSGDFSDHGDSGSLIFTGDGDGLAILHSGILWHYLHHRASATTSNHSPQPLTVLSPRCLFVATCLLHLSLVHTCLVAWVQRRLSALDSLCRKNPTVIIIKSSPAVVVTFLSKR